MTALLSVLGEVALVAIVATAAVTAVRIVRGPTLADRAVGADLLTLLGVGGAAALAMGRAEMAFLDVALGLSLFGFLATVALAYFLQVPPGTARRRDDPAPLRERDLVRDAVTTGGDAHVR
ncbi:MAG: monovalent cation/H+ antiporter complex subunit F [Rhodospirillales bacterium]|jgi:multisubunit Na+/H+ antiporter MnhF subunit